MGAMKNYVLGLLEQCAPENAFGQDAIELALLTGRITLTYDLKTDVTTIMQHYDEIIEAAHEQQKRNTAALLPAYRKLLAA